MRICCFGQYHYSVWGGGMRMFLGGVGLLFVLCSLYSDNWRTARNLLAVAIIAFAAMNGLGR